MGESARDIVGTANGSSVVLGDKTEQGSMVKLEVTMGTLLE